MEKAQSVLAEKVAQILDNKGMPLLLGGGHDMAYGHYNGIIKHIAHNQKIGIINLDAHFDLRSNEIGNNSGTLTSGVLPVACVARSFSTAGICMSRRMSRARGSSITVSDGRVAVRGRARSRGPVLSRANVKKDSGCVCDQVVCRTAGVGAVVVVSGHGSYAVLAKEAAARYWSVLGVPWRTDTPALEFPSFGKRPNVLFGIPSPSPDPERSLNAGHHRCPRWWRTSLRWIPLQS